MNPLLVGIAGPSGAGKSVFCRAMVQIDERISRLKFDDFFKDEQDVLVHDCGLTYWDHPSSIKWELLIAAARKLKRGEVAEVPNYRRDIDAMDGVKLVTPAEIILIDGFQVLYDERLRSLLDLTLFFDLDESLQVARRRERQPDVNDVYLNEIMLPAAREFLLPTKQYADVRIDASQSPKEVYRAGYEAIMRAYLDRVIASGGVPMRVVV